MSVGAEGPVRQATVQPPLAANEVSAADERAPSGRPARRRRSVAERFTPAMLVGLVAALVAFVVVAAVLKDRRATTTALVPTRAIAAGEALTPAVVRVVEIPVADGVTSALVTEADLKSGTLVAGRTLVVGEPVARSAVGAQSARPAARVMSLPLAGWGAAGGELSVGDQIDVIDTRADTTAYVVQGATVVARSGSTGGAGTGLGVTTSQVWVSIEVSQDQALLVAAVVEADKFVVVRSTGVHS